MEDFFRGVMSKEFAKKWEFGMVSGNGKQGVVVLGDPISETIIGNHISLYLPYGNDYQIPDMASYLETFREIIKTEGYDIANERYYEEAVRRGYAGLQMSDPSHPGFHLNIKSDISDFADYKRYTNFENGEIGVTFLDELGRHHFRRTFVSRADDLIIHHISNDQNDINCRLNVADYDQPLLSKTRSLNESGIGLRYQYSHDAGGYDVHIQVVVKNGEVMIRDREICINHAENVLILMKITVHENMETAIVIPIDLKGLPLDYDKLLARHDPIHREMFQRVSLELAGAESGRVQPTEILIEQAQTDGQLPRALIEKMYDAGRYMFICSAGEYIPNLQGIWSGDFNPPWSGDYTFDTNVQLAIASGLYSGLFEGIEGLFKLVKKFLPEWRENAQKYYGCRGILSSIHSSNSGIHVHWNVDWPLHLWTCGAGWLGHWFYDYYLHIGDKIFLKNEVIPYLKECVLFYEDFLILDDDTGYYRFTPSYSAENGCGDNATQDIAVAKEVLTNLIQAHKELGINPPEIQKWEAMLKKLPPYLINAEGALKEWAIPEKGENYNHRHFSHLYPIFQSREFNQESQPELWQASLIALEKRLEAWMRNADGDTTSSHGRMHAALCATRLNLPNIAYEAIQMMVLSNSIFPTLMTSHYNDFNIFNVDANGAIPQIIHEMLLYGEVGKIILLGAVPEILTKGKLSGISLPKEIKVDTLRWDLITKNLELALMSQVDQTVILEMPLFSGVEIDGFNDCQVDQSGEKIIVNLQKSKLTTLALKWC